MYVKQCVQRLFRPEEEAKITITTKKQHSGWRVYLSPLRITLLVINVVCFGGCIVLLTFGTVTGPLLLLTVGTGLSSGAGLTGVIVALHRNRDRRQSL